MRGLLLTALALCWIVLLVRLNGLRSFSKMTNFDFVATVAVGSLLAGAGQATDWIAYLQILAAITALFVMQFLVAWLRSRLSQFETVVQNEPLLLMRDGEMLEEALKKSRVTKDDLVAKLREANVLDYREVRAVVLETTGNISVLHGGHLDERLLKCARSMNRSNTPQADS